MSNNTALTILHCGSNQLTSLDVSHNVALTWLGCNDNQLTELDVSHNAALTWLGCYNNQLSKLDLSKNTALTGLNCTYNQLTELDLSKNTALTHLECWGQKRSGLKVKRTSEGYYEVNMKDYVSHLENIDADSIYPQPISYSKETGIITFSEPITELHYNYITHSPNNDLMPVTITNPLSIATLERSSSSTYGIICDMTDNSYLDSNGNPLDESVIRYYNYSDYGKLGLAADGNSRLILRVQTDKPGTVSFSGYDEIGAKLEALTSRVEIWPSELRVLSKIEDSLYQVSAVLVAPESFPISSKKKFPSDTFKVHVKFTDEDGEVTEDDLELKIEAAPVMLIHGLWGSAEKTFGKESGPGIWHQLKENGFTVGVCDYDGSKGPSEILNGNYNRLYLRLWDMFDKYSERGIVCTKADIVAFGMGGLIAEKYLSDEGKDSNDGNNWSVWSYKQGMVRRLISIATPYYGTPWADILLGTADVAKLYPGLSGTAFIADFMLSKLFGSSYISNLKNALSEMKTNRNPDIPDVPMHTIYGDVSHALDTAGYAIDLLGDAAIEFGMGLFATPWAAAAPVMCIVGLGGKFASMAEGLISAMFYHTGYKVTGHDLVVGVASATAWPSFIGNTSTCYTGWSSIHYSLTKREDIRNRISELLKGNADSFTPNLMGNANHSVRSLPVSVRADSASDEARLTEGIKLNMYRKVSEAADNNSQTVTITAISAQAALDEMYLAIGDEEGCCFFRLSSSDKTGKKFGGKLIFTSQDMGAIRAFCFSHNPNDSKGTSLLISNVAQVSDTSEEEDPT
ncbi:MAG: hypothetical protein II877_10615, partial [Synergistaceae bacterium]|nr:hypothetical protein [Synergistaceae bacterium]